MELQRIHLENIGCFKNRIFNVSNLSVIYGENRTGKSTLVYSIYFALFGSHLHKHLKIDDLCRKGEPMGTAVLFYAHGDQDYRLTRNTTGGKRILKNSQDVTHSPIISNRADAIETSIPVSADIAAITSFFREGELIWFLQDIPKYNKTLLQSLIGIDDALIIQSRFKKALALAKDRKKTFQSSKIPSRYAIDDIKKQLTETQAKFDLIEEQYKNQLGSHFQDLTELKALQIKYDDLQKNLKDASARKEKLRNADVLKQQQEELTKQIQEKEGVLLHKGELQSQIAVLDHKEAELTMRIRQLEVLKSQAACPTCEQPLSETHLAALAGSLKNQVAAGVKTRLQAKEALEKNNAKLRDIQKAEDLLKAADMEFVEHSRIDTLIATLTDELKTIETAIQQFKSGHPDIQNAEASLVQRKTLELQRQELQKQIVEQMAKIRQVENETAQFKKLESDIKQAERNELICTVAYRSVDHAIRELSSGILSRVQKSIYEWSNLFSILKEFDIQITDKELLPIIHAKGYQYKLNQMSKSERIFLYLMMKLAMGDALGHLGLFVLDDPADGLDLKRKEMLAHLLTEIARRRQVIVTSNDLAFADLFPPSSKIELGNTI